ncbi:class I adenylate-forming enzyme family protein [Rugamonas aquatica]|uniref:AMP-binding protein n=1 Tax=Rugamonas aquatica TaxID=2743357 RepID=A0A6A7N5R2_9BURK|nr:class I adenylate-forming enzyme family protein [Rugamonas aquatica]MQA40380.1 AMP-binding protein [Rugamonas aquatica]
MQTPESHLAPADLRLDQVVSYWAARRPEHSVLRDAAGRTGLVWREFEAAVASVARQLDGAIAPGQVVALVCANDAPFHVLLNALWRIGAGVLLLDRHWRAAIVDDLLTLLGCDTVFADAEASVSSNLAGLRRHAFPGWQDAPALPPAAGAARGHGLDQVALYATTSGTTDNPKCVAITHRQIRSAYRSCLASHDFSTVTRCACLFDINSLGVLGVCFLLPREVGAGTRLFPSFTLANVAASWNAVLDDASDFVYLVPPLVRLINTLPARPSAGPAATLAFCSAAPVAEQELQTLEARFPVRVFNCYGLTELTFAVFFGSRSDDGLASATIGPAHGVAARLVDADGRILDGPAQGELHLSGPMATGAYLHNARATGDSWEHGWLKTGDIAERDSAGRYYIRGRQKDMVLRGGYTYYLHELEHYLRRAPDVVDACAFKGRDLPSGDELCVVVQTAAATTASPLLQWIRDNLGVTKVPNALYVSARGLPRNSNGKILRNDLSRMHLDGTLGRWVSA